MSKDSGAALDPADIAREVRAIVSTRPGWQFRARCAQTDPDAFFPPKGGSTTEPKRICLSCPVRAECLEYALVNDERFGIWGGMSERERRHLARARRRGRRPAP